MSDKILKLDQAQTLYQDLRERIDALPTSEDITVTDVQVDGTSVVTGGVANVPTANASRLGTIMTSSTFGTTVSANGQGILMIEKATDTLIKNGTGSGSANRPIVPSNQHQSTFYGLAKAAGADMKDITNTTVGTYPDAQKAAIQNMLGITDLISTEESSTATAVHAINSTFMMGGKLYKATAAIAVGDAVVEGTNCQVAKADEVFVKNTDYAGENNYGIIKVGNGLYTDNQGVLFPNFIGESNIKKGTVSAGIISSARQHIATFYGLAKAAGADEKDSTLPLGQYTDTAKTAIRSLIGAAAASDIPSVPVQDVQIDGTSVLDNGIANLPKATLSTLGVVKAAGYGVQVNSAGQLYIYPAGINAEIKPGASNYLPIVPSTQHASVFYGLSKIAGIDLADATVTLGTYPETSKAAIRSLIGATSPDVIAVQDEQPTNADTKVWLPETEAQGIQVPTMEDMENYVQKTDYATYADFGIVRLQQYGGLQYDSTTRSIKIDQASSPLIKTGTDGLRPITSAKQHESVFYGLAKAAGDTTQVESNNSIGTYTYEAQLAIRTMLGVPGYPIANSMKMGNDGTRIISPVVQHEAVFYGLSKVAGVDLASVNDITLGVYPDSSKAAIQKMLGINTLFAAEETSTATAAHIANSLFTMNGKIYRATSAIAIGDAVVEGTNCEAVRADEVFVKNTDYANTSKGGVVKINSGNYGISIDSSGLIKIVSTDIGIKNGANSNVPVVASNTHIAAFYGLAKAAGDITQSASDNAIGTYTNEAKSAIHTMLGIDPASIAAQVDIPLVETVSGTTPSITGQPNVRYVCGEVSTISITPPASGSVDVIFESGSTAAVLTVPNTVKWPAWFDATALEADTTYEVLITDGVYGSVMTWAT